MDHNNIFDLWEMNVKLQLVEKNNYDLETFVINCTSEGVEDDELGAMILAKLGRVIKFGKLSDSAFSLYDNKKIKMDLSFYEKFFAKHTSGINFSIETKMFLVNLASDNGEANTDKCAFSEYSISDYHLDTFATNNENILNELRRSGLLLNVYREDGIDIYVFNMKKIHKAVKEFNFKGCDL
ncbi:hypothetical protein [Cetobacterium sp.]|uniref:hypothetical protein n=1 Tax=Cetobacterium sp. TaxID=2071632 RepID=UPI003F3E4B3E